MRSLQPTCTNIQQQIHPIDSHEELLVFVSIARVVHHPQSQNRLKRVMESQLKNLFTMINKKTNQLFEAQYFSYQ